jgi:hypothetical protein
MQREHWSETTDKWGTGLSLCPFNVPYLGPLSLLSMSAIPQRQKQVFNFSGRVSLKTHSPIFFLNSPEYIFHR